MRSRIIAILSISLCAIACGKDDNQAGKAAAATLAPTPPPTQAPAPIPTPSAAPKPVQHVELQIASVANTMGYDKTALSVPAEAEVLTLKNNATMSTLPHNWVLVNTGTEASVAAAGLKLGEPAGYLNVSGHDVLAHTTLAKPGESTEVTFTAPSTPGAYPYICTVPGHYMMMKGVLTVTP